METYQNLKKGTRTGLAVAYVLCLLIIAKSLAEIVPSIQSHNIFAASFAFLDMTMIVAVFWYSITGYKIPHGNALKYLFFAFAIYLVLGGTLKLVGKNWYLTGDMMILSALVIAYVSGRMDKIEKNRTILFFAGLLLFVEAVITIVISSASSGRPLLSYIVVNFVPLVIQAALSFAYIARYEEHKAAGLEDAN